jgi:hypothetical protein
MFISNSRKKKYKNPNEMSMFKALLLLDINTRFDQFDAKFGTQKNQQEQMQQAASKPRLRLLKLWLK